MSDFERKAKVVAGAYGMMEGRDEWAPILDKFNLGFPYAWLVVAGLGTLNPEGERYVTAAYDFLVRNAPAKEYNTYLEVLMEGTE